MYLEFRSCFMEIGTFRRHVSGIIVVPSGERFPGFDKKSRTIGCVNGRIKSRLYSETNGRHYKTFPCISCSERKECENHKLIYKGIVPPIVLFDEIGVQ